jgi:hypothetical protein
MHNSAFNSLDSDLQKFEDALRKIGASDWYLRNTKRAEYRQQKIDEMYKTLADVLGQENMVPEWQAAISRSSQVGWAINCPRVLINPQQPLKPSSPM